MQVVIETATNTVLGAWRGTKTELFGLLLDPPQHCVQKQGVNPLAPADELFTHVDSTTHHVENRRCFECDFCHMLGDGEPLKLATTRPSDPWSACSVMWSCRDCGKGKTDAQLAEEFEAQGIAWEG